jgi:uncharacterized protein (TIGR01777 family)
MAHRSEHLGASSAMMVFVKLVLAGASGFLGTRLRVRLATAGHQTVQLVRRTPTEPDQRQWWPDRGEVPADVIAGADAVINLAGAGVEDKRWDDAYRVLLRTSRVEPTTTLARAIADAPEGHRPALLNASAVGFYGHSGDLTVDEDAPAGDSFLAELCQAWEAATRPAVDAGARVVRLRIGMPLDASGGLLKPLLLPFRLGVGGRLGDGRQWMPWVSMRDWLSTMDFLLARPEIAGAVNLVGPHPVQNREFSAVLGRVLHRPAVTVVPSFALRVILGGLADEALTSQRVVPTVLLRHGFTFEDSTLDTALRATLT